MTMPRPAPRSRLGFTLFEVLAAVAVLGLLYTVLARVAIHGLRAEGEANRRMQASLLADRALGDLQAELAAGGAASIGVTEREVGDFTLEVEIQPFDAGALLRTAPNADTEALAKRELELLSPPARGGSAALLSAEVRVRWQEGVYEQRVIRNSFALDLEAAAPLLETIAPTDGQDQGQGQSRGQGEQPLDEGPDGRPR